MAYATIDDPASNFDTVLTTGTGNAQEISTLSFQPDWIWGKRRDSSGHQTLFDSVRGVTKGLEANRTNAEFTSTDYYSSFDNDGFTIAAGAAGAGNGNGQTAVQYCWKAGTSFSNDASATSIGTIDSTGSVNQTAGFSICSYTGNQTSGATIKHGLSTAPKVIIIKKRSNADNWTILNTNISLNTHFHLTGDGAISDPMFNNTAPTTAIFTVDSDGQVNSNNDTFIAYCFSEVKGYSKFGSYTGNGNSNGPFVYCGFRPAYVIVKSATSSVNWKAFDNKRNPHNGTTGNTFNLNEDGAEDDNSAYKFHFHATGFKVRNSNANLNSNGNTFTYYAWAESPIVNSNGIPNNAR